MSLVNILDVQILDNPAPFANPFQFEITFECIAQLEEDLEWRIIYVGSAESEEHDQVLDNIMVGPVPLGVNKFVFQAPSPALDKIPAQDAVGVTVVLLTCSYMQREFVRIGYYVSNEYNQPELNEQPPAQVDWSQIVRFILSDKPRVTRFPIAWTKDAPEMELPVVEGNPDEEPAEFEVGANSQQADDDQGMDDDDVEDVQDEDDEPNADEEEDLNDEDSDSEVDEDDEMEQSVDDDQPVENQVQQPEAMAV